MVDLRLSLFLGSSAEIITLAEFLALEPVDRVRVKVSPDWACVSLLLDGVEQWGPRLSFGALGPLVEQLLPAAARLQRAERAVICAGASDGPVSEYIVLDPANGEVTAAIAAFDANESWDWLPPTMQGDDLYAFIDTHLDRMIGAGSSLRNLRPVHVDRAAIMQALVREAALGRRAIEALGFGRS